MRTNYIIMIFSLLFFSCKEKAIVNNREKVEYKYELIGRKNICFKLDSITSHIFTASEYNDKTRSYAFIHRNRLLVYDYETQELTNDILIKAANPTSFSFINKDTIIVSDYNANSFLFMDSRGSVYKSIKVNPKILYYPFPVNKIAPLKYENDTIIFWGNMSGEYINENKNNRNVMGIVDISNGQVQYNVPYSNVYNARNWGGGLYRWVYACYNSKENKYIVSFPADHNIYKVYTTGIIGEFYAGSNFIDEIEFLDTPKWIPINSEEKTKHFVENHSYANIIYDKWREVYYRIAEIKTKYENKMGWQKEISVIILNKNLKIIGETKIKECNHNYRYAIFVNEKGLHIPQNTDEDVLCFKIYNLCIK